MKVSLKFPPPQPPHGAISNKLFSEPVMAVIINIKHSDEMHRVVLKIAYMHYITTVELDPTDFEHFPKLCFL